MLLCTLLLTGCWDRRELNQIGILVAVGLDKEESTGNILMTSQVVRPAALKREGGEPSSPVEIITATGETMADAVKNISKQFDRIAFFAHVKVLVISEELAKEGLQPILDYYLRSSNTRSLIWVIIAKGDKAKDILTTSHSIENVQATYLDNIIINSRENSEVTTTDLITYLKVMAGEGNPVSGVMEIVKQSAMPTKDRKEPFSQGVKLLGTAVFKKDKMIGYLNTPETRGLNWITDNIKKTIINIPSPNEAGKLVAISVTKASSRIIPESKDGTISFTIEVEVDGDIAEQQDVTNYFSNLDQFAELEKIFGGVVEKEIKLTMDKVQKEYASDIVGFGTIYARNYPQEWNQAKEEWDALFPKVEYAIKVNTRLRNLGLTLQPIKLKGNE